MGKGDGYGLFGSSERARKKREAMRKYSKYKKQQDDDQQKEYAKKRIKMRRKRNEKQKMVGRIRYLYIPTAITIALGAAMIFGSTIPALGQGTILWEERERFHVAGPIVTGIGILFLMIVSGLSNYHLEKTKRENEIRKCKYCARMKGLDVSDSSSEEADEQSLIERYRKKTRRKSSYVCRESGSGLHYVCKTDDDDKQELASYLNKKRGKRRSSYVMKENQSGIFHVVKTVDETEDPLQKHHGRRKLSHYKASHESGLERIEEGAGEEDDLLADTEESDDSKHKHKRRSSYVCKEDEYGLYHVVKTDEINDDMYAHHLHHHEPHRHKHKLSTRRARSDSNINVIVTDHDHDRATLLKNEHEHNEALLSPNRNVELHKPVKFSCDKAIQTDGLQEFTTNQVLVSSIH